MSSNSAPGRVVSRRVVSVSSAMAAQLNFSKFSAISSQPKDSASLGPIQEVGENPERATAPTADNRKRGEVQSVATMSEEQKQSFIPVNQFQPSSDDEAIEQEEVIQQQEEE